MKLLLDTDIGSDIDDAICLAYLLAHPDCDLLGITTVTGEPIERARLASAICRAVGQETPIFPGAPRPLLAPVRQPHAPQATALAQWPHEQEFPGGQAISFLRDTIRRYPGEVSLLAIGPMTNIALLFALDPEIPQLLSALYLMIGAFSASYHADRPEWNALNDPHAAAVVYSAQNAAPLVHRSIGLDVTTQVEMEAAEVRRRFRTPRLQPVLDMAEVWFAARPSVVFHDPLAAVSIFNGAVCDFTRGRVQVELCNERQAGATYFIDDERGPHEVAFAVNPQRFFDDFFSVTSR